MSLITTNKSAFLYSTSIESKIKNICSPLAWLGLKGFGYLKIFKDATYMGFMNGFSEYLEKFFINILTQDKTFFEAIKKYAVQKEFSYFIWPIKLPKEHSFELVYEYGLWHGLTIFYKLLDSVECFCFTFDRNSDNKANFYINNIEILTKFSLYFKKVASDLIDCSDKSRLAIFKSGIPADLFCEPSLTPKQNINQLLNHINMATDGDIDSTIRESGYFSKFSKQQFNCIALLAQGRTMKEIGRLLNISPRTVESYIENIKDKTGYNSKSQILDLFWNNKRILEL